MAGITPTEWRAELVLAWLSDKQTVHGSPCIALVRKLLKIRRKHCDAGCRTVYDKVMRGK